MRIVFGMMVSPSSSSSDRCESDRWLSSWLSQEGSQVEACLEARRIECAVSVETRPAWKRCFSDAIRCRRCSMEAVERSHGDVVSESRGEWGMMCGPVEYGCHSWLFSALVSDSRQRHGRWAISRPSNCATHRSEGSGGTAYVGGAPVAGKVVIE